MPIPDHGSLHHNPTDLWDGNGCVYEGAKGAGESARASNYRISVFVEGRVSYYYSESSNRQMDL